MQILIFLTTKLMYNTCSKQTEMNLLTMRILDTRRQTRVFSRQNPRCPRSSVIRGPENPLRTELLIGFNNPQTFWPSRASILAFARASFRRFRAWRAWARSRRCARVFPYCSARPSIHPSRVRFLLIGQIRSTFSYVLVSYAFPSTLVCRSQSVGCYLKPLHLPQSCA